MKTLASLLTITALTASSAAFAQQADTPAKNDPGLSDGLLSGVFAGDVQQRQASDFSELDNFPESGLPETGGAVANGGTVATGDLDSRTDVTARVTLDKEAQADASGLNVVNDSESLTATPINLNTTRKSATGLGDAAISTGGSSSLAGLLPLETGSLYVTEQQNAVTQSDATSGGIGSYDTFSSAVVTSTSSTNSLTSNSEVDTEIEVLGQKLQGGSGGAGSGSLDVSLDGGSIDVKPRIVTEGGGEVAWGLFSADAKVTAESPLNIQLPELELGIDGSGCGVNGGSCTANGSQETSDSATQSLASAPVSSLSNVSGKYVALGNAEIREQTLAEVSLSNNAQTRAQALNLLNSANSLTAAPLNVNAVNGANISQSNGALVRQTNSVRQVR